MMEMRAAGGTRAPLMLDWLMWLSMPNVNAEWENPASGGKEKKTSVCSSHGDRLTLTRVPRGMHMCFLITWGSDVYIEINVYMCRIK